MNEITAYLKSISSCPDLYDSWQKWNERLFDGVLNPMPIIISLSDYGSFAAYAAMDHIGIQPKTYDSGKAEGMMDGVIATLIHEMCHQADHQEGIRYTQDKKTRVNNLHNTAAWCNRINSVMEKLSDHRFATTYRRDRSGKMVPMNEAPEGLALLPYKALATWEPLGEFLN